jgi:hypothetical protein
MSNYICSRVTVPSGKDLSPARLVPTLIQGEALFAILLALAFGVSKNALAVLGAPRF